MIDTFLEHAWNLWSLQHNLHSFCTVIWSHSAKCNTKMCPTEWNRTCWKHVGNFLFFQLENGVMSESLLHLCDILFMLGTQCQPEHMSKVIKGVSFSTVLRVTPSVRHGNVFGLTFLFFIITALRARWSQNKLTGGTLKSIGRGRGGEYFVWPTQLGVVH